MSNIKILISCHKEADHPHSDILLPIQVGATIAPKRFEGMLQDDGGGDHISSKNPMYCELTAQYWAWKNLDADYYGFCHYRRYFNFSATSYTEDEWGNVREDYIDEQAVKKYGLNDETITRRVEGYDILTTTRQDLQRLAGHYRSVLDQYQRAPLLHGEDLQLVLDIIDEQWPEMSKAAHRHCEGHITSFCNMYILKKEWFFDYCEWMFAVLEEFERRRDVAQYSQEALRTPGHLSERLFGIYYLYLLEKRPDLRIGELQCVLFENTDPQPMLRPAFDGPEVPVVFAANDRFVPMAATCIRSLVEHTNPARNYDLILLESDVTAEHKVQLQGMLTGYSNVSLRFFNAARMLRGYKLKAQAHISVETYFRFLIQDILPYCDKVLYLDCDLVVQRDVAELYDTELEDHLLAAARDPDFLGQINGANPQTLAYCQTELKMQDPYQYFQAGVLLFNTKAMRETHTLHEWLTFAAHPYKYSDQDVLNLHCEGRVKFLDMRWNLLTDCDHYRVANVITYAPAGIFQAYKEARKAPYIIHYAGYLKPWHRADEDFASVFWEYARRTPFYEILLTRMLNDNAWHIAHGLDSGRGLRGLVRKVLGIPRRVVDHFYPKGSDGREKLKRVYHIFVKSKQ